MTAANTLQQQVLQIVQAARQGQPVEDSRVEVKSELPADVERTARRLAGQANAAAGGSITWVVGLREDGRIVGARRKEIDSWYRNVAKKFDGPALPLSQCVAARVGGKTVLGLMFRTDNPPYVVCKSDGAKEIPWREGNGTRSANRDELVGLLREFARQPEVDVLRARLDMGVWRKGSCGFAFAAELYFKPRLGNQLTIPFRDCYGFIEIPDIAKRTRFDDVKLSSLGTRFASNDEYYDKHIVIRKPGPVRIDACGAVRSRRFRKAEAMVEILLRPVNSMRPIAIRTRHLGWLPIREAPLGSGPIRFL